MLNDLPLKQPYEKQFIRMSDQRYKLLYFQDSSTITERL